MSWKKSVTIDEDKEKQQDAAKIEIGEISRIAGKLSSLS